MKTREQKIEAIYDKVADKTLSFGCKIKAIDGEGIIIYSINKGKTGYIFGKSIYNILTKELIELENFKIIGHTIYIGDVLDYIENDDYFETITDIQQELIEIWGYKRKPIEEQSTECIDFIYNLLGLGTEKN